ETKLNTVAAASEEVDIIWTSSWAFNWLQNQNKGVFQPITELLKTHGQKLYESMPEKFWNDSTLNGEIWAVPNFQISAQRPSVIVRNELAEKYNLNVSSIKEFADLEPFLQQVKDNEAGIVPFGVAKSFWSGILNNWDPF